MELVRLLELAGLRNRGGHGGVDGMDAGASGVAYDSRQVRAGMVFVALVGDTRGGRRACDGHDFIGDALQRGAVAVVGTRAGLALSVPYIQVADARAALGDLAAAYFGFPGDALELVGVTGTKGKTTTTAMIRHLLERAGRTPGSISTVGASWGQQYEPPFCHFTTPEAPDLQGMLARFVASGCDAAVIEASSHGLALDRVRGLRFRVGVWTNLEPDHLDFHSDLEAYAMEKAKLIDRADFAIVNADDPYAPAVDSHSSWTFGRDGDWRLTDVREGTTGCGFSVVSPIGRFDVSVPMLGAFNAMNALAAIAAGEALGIDREILEHGLTDFPGVAGRMEVVANGDVRVLVDFAHTERSLFAMLKSVRVITTGRVIVVAGCASGRDPSRRAGLGRSAALAADVIILTEDDSHGEAVGPILAEMQRAVLDAGGVPYLEPDRAAAIQYAISIAELGDTVVVAGKGHERTLERNGTNVPWDDVEECRRALETRCADRPISWVSE